MKGKPLLERERDRFRKHDVARSANACLGSPLLSSEVAQRNNAIRASPDATGAKRNLHNERWDELRLEFLVQLRVVFPVVNCVMWVKEYEGAIGTAYMVLSPHACEGKVSSHLRRP